MSRILRVLCVAAASALVAGSASAATVLSPLMRASSFASVGFADRVTSSYQMSGLTGMRATWANEGRQVALSTPLLGARVQVSDPDHRWLGSQLPGVPGIPEAAQWSLLILGIGLIGAERRTSRSRAALVAA